MRAAKRQQADFFAGLAKWSSGNGLGNHELCLQESQLRAVTKFCSHIVATD